MITSIRVIGFKGQSRTLKFSANRVVLGGPVGAGKTTTLEALRLALCLPTRFGEKNLGALGNNGQWTIEVVAGGTSLERRMQAGRSDFFVNGRKRTQGEYLQDLGRIIAPLEPHHLDLNAFVELSGQKRAEHISRLLASDRYDGPGAVHAASGISLAEFVKHESAGEFSSGDVEGSFGDILNWTGSPGEIVAGPATELVNKLARQLDQETQRLRGLEAQPAPARGDLAALQAKIMALSEQIGSLDTQIKDAAERRELKGRLEAAVQTARSTMADTQSRLDAINTEEKALRELIPQLKKQADEAEAKETAKRDERATALTKRAEAIAMTQAATTLAGLLCESCKKKLTQETPPIPDVDAATEAHKQAAAEATAKAKELRANVEKMAGAQRTQASLKTSLARAQKDEEEHLTRLTGVMVPDTGLLDQSREGLVAERTNVTDQRKQAELAASLDRDLEGARLSVSKCMLAVEVAKKLREALQRWRDRVTKEGASNVLDPLRRALREINGRDDTDVEMVIEGSGASTKCRLMFCRGPRKVAFEHLSGGESVLVGAAFLSTLQASLGAGLKILTMDVEALDLPWWHRFAMAMPLIPADFIIVANNHARAADCPKGVEFIDLGK